MELIRTFDSEDFERGLSSWLFLDLHGKEPLFTSPFGDVFFSSADGYWFLSLIDGELTREWDSHAEMERVLNTEVGDDSFLLGAVAHAAEMRGVAPGAAEVYDFTVPPIIGGSFAVDNVAVTRFVTKLDVTGQLFTKLRGLPPDPKVERFTTS